MENVKYVCRKPLNSLNITDYVFHISEGIANLIREYSNYPKNKLLLELTEENEYIYRIGSMSKNGPYELDNNVIRTIEQISNKYNEEGFWNNLLTDNGIKRTPANVHDLIEKEYGIEGEEIEWWVAHFFIGLSELVFSHEYD